MENAGLKKFIRAITGMTLILIVSGCGSDGAAKQDAGAAKSASTSIAALSISPSSVAVTQGSSTTFSSAGGAGGYSYSIYSGGGSIDANGYFTAPSSAGTVYVALTDSGGSVVYATVTIQASQSSLAISPSITTVNASSSTAFTASGGSGSYIFSIYGGGGSINAGTGSFTAPSSADTVYVQVTDSSGAVASATVTVRAGSALSMSPSSTTMNVLTSVTFSASGGTGGYRYSILDGGGTINSTSGRYTAPSVPASVTLQVRDSSGQVATASIYVNAVSRALSVSPSVVRISRSAQIQLVASGGNGEYTYSIHSGGGGINSDGRFTALNADGLTQVRVADSSGMVVYAQVTVGVSTVNVAASALSFRDTNLLMAPSSTTTLSAVGGSGVYTYSIHTGGGTINSSTGRYTAPSSTGNASVKVTDSRGAVNYASITVEGEAITTVYITR